MLENNPYESPKYGIDLPPTEREMKKGKERWNFAIVGIMGMLMAVNHSIAASISQEKSVKVQDVKTKKTVETREK